MSSERPLAILPRFPGTNCDRETARALELVGFQTRTVPTASLTPADLTGAQLVVFSGGFSYGDYVMSGRIAQLITEQRLGSGLKDFVAAGGHVLGICNGFQILTKLGLLPAASLIENESGRFQCRWVKMRLNRPDSPYLRELPTDADIEFPIAHAEGRLIAPDQLAYQYRQQGLAALIYTENPNGSQESIAALTDTTGRVFGLMPHPERFIYREQHYDRDWDGDPLYGWGYYFFQSIYRSISQTTPLLA